MGELTGIDTALAVADADDARARALLVMLGAPEVHRLDAQLRAYALATRAHRNDRPVASALVASMRANVGVSPYARVGAVLVDQVACSHVRPGLAVAAVRRELRDAAAALLGAIAATTSTNGIDPVRLEDVDFVAHVVRQVAASVSTVAYAGFARADGAPPATVPRMLVALDQYCRRARRRSIAHRPELTTWQLETARRRIAAFLSDEASAEHVDHPMPPTTAPATAVAS